MMVERMRLAAVSRREGQGKGARAKVEGKERGGGNLMQWTDMIWME